MDRRKADHLSNDLGWLAGSVALGASTSSLGAGWNERSQHCELRSGWVEGQREGPMGHHSCKSLLQTGTSGDWQCRCFIKGVSMSRGQMTWGLPHRPTSLREDRSGVGGSYHHHFCDLVSMLAVRQTALNTQEQGVSKQLQVRCGGTCLPSKLCRARGRRIRSRPSLST